jgi:hypothetical protein
LIIIIMMLIFGVGLLFSVPVAMLLFIFFKSCFTDSFIKLPEILIKAIFIGIGGSVVCFFVFALIFRFTASQNIPLCAISAGSGVAAILCMSFSVHKTLIKREEEEEYITQIGLPQ